MKSTECGCLDILAGWQYNSKTNIFPQYPNPQPDFGIYPYARSGLKVKVKKNARYF